MVNISFTSQFKSGSLRKKSHSLWLLLQVTLQNGWEKMEGGEGCYMDHVPKCLMAPEISVINLC